MVPAKCARRKSPPWLLPRPQHSVSQACPHAQGSSQSCSPEFHSLIPRASPTLGQSLCFTFTLVFQEIDFQLSLKLKINTIFYSCPSCQKIFLGPRTLGVTQINHGFLRVFRWSNLFPIIAQKIFFFCLCIFSKDVLRLKWDWVLDLVLLLLFVSFHSLRFFCTLDSMLMRGY